MRIFLLINFVGFYLISAETPEEKEGVKYGKQVLFLVLMNLSFTKIKNSS